MLVTFIGFLCVKQPQFNPQVVFTAVFLLLLIMIIILYRLLRCRIAK